MCGIYLIFFYLRAMCYMYILISTGACVRAVTANFPQLIPSLYYFVLFFETSPCCVSLTACNSLWKQGWPPAQRGPSTPASLHSCALASSFMYRTGSLTEPESVLIWLKKSVVSHSQTTVSCWGQNHYVHFLHGFGGPQAHAVSTLQIFLALTFSVCLFKMFSFCFLLKLKKNPTRCI